MAGYIKLYRGSRDTDGLLPSDHYSDWEAWTWLLENAAWKDTSRWNAKGEEIRLQPGQIHVSLRSLSTSWGWSKSKVERFLSRLERVGKAGQSTGQSGIVLTIENWAKYQGSETDNGTATETASGQPRDTQEEGKEDKKKNNITRCPEGVTPETWSDFLALRKAKRATVSQSIVTGIAKKAASIGWSLQDALAVMCERGWQGFDPEWVEAKTKPKIVVPV